MPALPIGIGVFWKGAADRIEPGRGDDYVIVQKPQGVRFNLGDGPVAGCRQALLWLEDVAQP